MYHQAVIIEHHSAGINTGRAVPTRTDWRRYGSSRGPTHTADASVLTKLCRNPWGGGIPTYLEAELPFDGCLCRAGPGTMTGASLMWQFQRSYVCRRGISTRKAVQ